MLLKLRYREISLARCHLTNHKCHVELPSNEPGPPQWAPAPNRLSHVSALERSLN
jgi:hypothetical protein